MADITAWRAAEGAECGQGHAVPCHHLSTFTGSRACPGPVGQLVGSFFEENKWKSKCYATSPLGLHVAGDSLGPFRLEAQGGLPEGAGRSLWEMHLLGVPTSPPATSSSPVLRSFQCRNPCPPCPAPVRTPRPAGQLAGLRLGWAVSQRSRPHSALIAWMTSESHRSRPAVCCVSE